MLRLGLRVIGCLIGFGGLNGEDNHQISNIVPNINQVCFSCKLVGLFRGLALCPLWSVARRVLCFVCRLLTVSVLVSGGVDLLVLLHLLTYSMYLNHFPPTGEPPGHYTGGGGRGKVHTGKEFDFFKTPS
jgi:hypothetical protein